MRTDSTFSVVIAGGGFCGVMTLVNLIKKSQSKTNITLINKGYPIARGVAYYSYTDQHILNVQSRNMSAFPDSPDHFIEWCSSQKEIDIDKDILPFSFLPRNVYGKYIESIFNDSIKNIPDHLTVNIVNDEVIDIEKNNDSLLVKCLNGELFYADKVVLATGNSEPGPPVLTDPKFLKSKNYFSNPWCENAVLGLGEDDSVLIIGTGLTMVDVIIGLRDKKFKGKIISLSPHGFNILPHRNSRPQRYILDELAPPYNLETLFKLFYKHIRQAKKHGESGETVVDAIRANTQEIWQNLSLADKKKFMTHLRHLWGVARHRLPAHVYEQVQQMIRERKLEVIAGRIKNIKESEKGIEVNILKRKGQSELSLQFARIINCTGPQSDIRKQNSTLFNQLIKRGFIRPDEMSLGIDATAEGQTIDSENNVSDQIFAIGSLLKGKLWESTAVPELRIQANKVAELINTFAITFDQ